MQTHNGRRYACNIAGCTFTATQASAVTTHKRSHSGERPFACSLCSFSAAHKSSIKTHMRSHSGEKPYKCAEQGCGFEAAYFWSLTLHKRAHQSNTVRQSLRPCPHCDHQEASPQLLCAHILHEHSSVSTQLFPCLQPSCGYIGKYRWLLARHTKSQHSMEGSAFSCSKCGLLCASRSDLISHSRTHKALAGAHVQDMDATVPHSPYPVPPLISSAAEPSLFGLLQGGNPLSAAATDTIDTAAPSSVALLTGRSTADSSAPLDTGRSAETTAT